MAAFQGHSTVCYELDCEGNTEVIDTQPSTLQEVSGLAVGDSCGTECITNCSRVSRKEAKVVWTRDPGKATLTEEQPSELILETNAQLPSGHGGEGIPQGR